MIGIFIKYQHESKVLKKKQILMNSSIASWKSENSVSRILLILF